MFYAITLPDDTYIVTCDNYSYKLTAAGIVERTRKGVKTDILLLQWSQQKKKKCSLTREIEEMSSSVNIYGCVGITLFMYLLPQFSIFLIVFVNELI